MIHGDSTAIDGKNVADVNVRFYRVYRACAFHLLQNIVRSSGKFFAATFEIFVLDFPIQYLRSR